jgi:transposase InsO family protein
VPEAARAAHPHRRPGLPVEVSGAISGLAAAADTSLTGKRVAELLDAIAAERGYPKSITVDNGTEFYSKAMDSWAYHRGVQLQFIRPGKPVENAFIESWRPDAGRVRQPDQDGDSDHQ